MIKLVVIGNIETAEFIRSARRAARAATPELSDQVMAITYCCEQPGAAATAFGGAARIGYIEKFPIGLYRV